jgi:hypothetical protein
LNNKISDIKKPPTEGVVFYDEIKKAATVYNSTVAASVLHAAHDA